MPPTAWAATAMGQAYPNEPVRVIVPPTAGSATDILARTFGQKLAEFGNQSVVVDNRPGARGTIGAAMVAKAPADGYTLLVHSAAPAYNPSIRGCRSNRATCALPGKRRMRGNASRPRLPNRCR